MKLVTLDFTNREAVERVFNQAFRHPEQQYTIQPTNEEQASAWLKEYTDTVNFVWCAGVKSFEQRLAEAGPLHNEQLIHLDTLYGRNRCGWAAGSYHCDHPDHADAEICQDRDCEECEELGKDDQGQPRHKCLCFASNCPIASQVTLEDLRKLDPSLAEEYKDSDEGESCGDWMVLDARPRYAYVPNVTVLGCERVHRL